jgi:hypothetical protein
MQNLVERANLVGQHPGVALGYDLTIYEPEWDSSQRYTMTGQLYGFGRGRDWADNYNGESWLKEKLPEDVRKQIVFDSEQGQFFCYSDSLEALTSCMDLMDEAINLIR